MHALWFVMYENCDNCVSSFQVILKIEIVKLALSLKAEQAMQITVSNILQVYNYEQVL